MCSVDCWAGCEAVLIPYCCDIYNQPCIAVGRRRRGVGTGGDRAVMTFQLLFVWRCHAMILSSYDNVVQHFVPGGFFIRYKRRTAVSYSSDTEKLKRKKASFTQVKMMRERRWSVPESFLVSYLLLRTSSIFSTFPAVLLQAPRRQTPDGHHTHTHTHT